MTIAPPESSTTIKRHETILAKENQQPAVTQEAAQQMRNHIHELLLTAKQQAESSGKPLLILVGENHYSRKGALLMSMIYQESRELGGSDIALELPHLNGKGKKLFETTMDQSTLPLSRRALIGHTYAYALAKANGDSVHMVDGKHLEASKHTDFALEPRNDSIAANLAQISRPALMLTGADHLPGIQQRMQRYGTHQIIAFDISSDSSQANAKIAHLLQLDGDARKLDTKRFLEYGLGEEPAEKFSTWAQQKGYQLNPGLVRHLIDEMVTDSKTRALAPKELRTLATAFYEVGQHSVASKLALEAIKQCVSIKPKERAAQCDDAYEEESISVSRFMHDKTYTDMSAQQQEAYLASLKQTITSKAQEAQAVAVQAPINDKALTISTSIKASGITLKEAPPTETKGICTTLNEHLGQLSPCKWFGTETPANTKPQPSRK